MAINEEIIIDLNFVPAWARKPADQNPYVNQDQPREERRRREDGRMPRDRRPADRRAASGSVQRAGGKPSPERARDAVRLPSPAFREGQANRGLREPAALPPVIAVSFIPERRGLKPLARWMKRTGRAYPLLDIAGMFLSKPDYYAIKLEVESPRTSPPADSAPVTLIQCHECKRVFLERHESMAHGLNDHFDLFYAREEIQIDPPKGNFVCVARCGCSGELLGPPNYHGFNEKVLELHKTRFAHMTLEAYRHRIVNESDPALIEQWKQQACRQITYRTLRDQPLQVLKSMADVESHFAAHHAPTLFHEGTRFIMPGPVSREVDNPVLSRCIRDAWTRENHFPFKISIAIRPAFRHLGLYIFKVGDTITFISAVHPNPIEPAQTTDTIKPILQYLLGHPGRTRQEMVHDLMPDAVPESSEVAALIHSLQWLIEKGHVIEFYNGKLSVPRGHVRVGTNAAVKKDEHVGTNTVVTS